jgi:hypothetical protein
MQLTGEFDVARVVRRSLAILATSGRVVARTALMVLAGLVLLEAGVVTSAGQTDDPVFDASGFQRNRDYFSQLPFENIDTLSGGLTLTFTDLVLPGNAGFDLRFQRTFNSKGGVAWRFGIEGLVMEVSERADDGPPTLHGTDGGRDGTTWMSNSNADHQWAITGRFWKYDRINRKLYIPDGRVLSFDADHQLEDISDAFNNHVRLERRPDGLHVLQDLGEGHTRDVVFAYANGSQLPTSMTYLGRT